METMTFGKAIKTCFNKYATFKGRARRAEYWYWELFNLLVSLGLSVLQGIVSIPALLHHTSVGVTSTIFTVITVCWSLAILVPSISVAVRRLHDTSHSGWWLAVSYAIALIGIVLFFCGFGTAALSGETPDMSNINIPLASISGALIIVYFALCIVMLVWFIKNSTPGSNRYGNNPKAETPQEDITAPQSAEV